MPRFSEQEKASIRQELLLKGKELFIQYGLAKTSIDQIVHACGIAKGSFYKFFASKEELFYIILKQEENVRDQLLSELLREDLPPKELVLAFFRKAMQIVEDRPFLRLTFQEGEYERLVRKLPPEVTEAYRQDDKLAGVHVISQLMNQGILRPNQPEVVSGVIQAVLMLQLFKDRIGSELFPAVMSHIMDAVAQGIAADSSR
jgi:AcrR family transcriptional regulator